MFFHKLGWPAEVGVCAATLFNLLPEVKLSGDQSATWKDFLSKLPQKYKPLAVAFALIATRESLNSFTLSQFSSLNPYCDELVKFTTQSLVLPLSAIIGKVSLDMSRNDSKPIKEIFWSMEQTLKRNVTKIH